MERVVRVLALSLLPAVALAGELQDDLKARRARVMEAIGPESILVHWSAPTAGLLARRGLRVPPGQRPCCT